MRLFQSHINQPARLHRVEPVNRKVQLLKLRAVFIIIGFIVAAIFFIRFCYAVPVGTDSNIYYYHLAAIILGVV